MFQSYLIITPYITHVKTSSIYFISEAHESIQLIRSIMHVCILNTKRYQFLKDKVLILRKEHNNI